MSIDVTESPAAGAASGSPTHMARLDGCIDRAVEHMFSIQHPDGYWWGELEANITMAAERLMLERFLTIEDPQRTAKIARYILERQQPDGSWPIYYAGPGDPSVTIEAYFALKLAGITPDSPAMVRARDFILAHGGIGGIRAD